MSADGAELATARVRALVRAARRIADPNDALGVEARATLPGATGLSPEGVEFALGWCLETDPSDVELAALVASVRAMPAAHVVLSAGVFVGAHRAIARALAASSRVFVKPSRRNPEMTRLIALAAPELFAVVPRVAPSPGDAVFAYGSDESLGAIASGLGPSVAFEGHGSGIGVAFIEARGASTEDIEAACRLLTDDVVLFDQRGCLSPRIALVVGSEREALGVGRALATALARADARVPRGRLSPDEAGAATRYRDTVRFAGEVFTAGPSYVGVDVRGERLVLPPPGRNVHVVRAANFEVVRPLAPLVAAVGVHGPEESYDRARAVVPRARIGPLGRMQRPPFDGPVDLRNPSFQFASR